MAFTVTTMTYTARKAKLNILLSYVSNLITLNEEAEKLRARLVAEGQTDAEVGASINKLLGACGPPFIAAATDLVACTGDTVADRIVNMLGTATVGTSIGWSHLTS